MAGIRNRPLSECGAPAPLWYLDTTLSVCKRACRASSPAGMLTDRPGSGNPASAAIGKRRGRAAFRKGLVAQNLEAALRKSRFRHARSVVVVDLDAIRLEAADGSHERGTGALFKPRCGAPGVSRRLRHEAVLHGV